MAYPVLNTQNISGYQNLPLSNNNNQGTNNPQLANKTVAINEDLQITSGLASSNNNDYSSFIQSYSNFADNITIKKQLGKGIQGIVFKGYFKYNGSAKQKIAVKTTKNTKSIKDLSGQQIDRSYTKYTIDEINTLLKLRHSENIVKIISAFEEEIAGNFFNFKVHIVMELASISLKDYRQLRVDRKINISKENGNYAMKECLSGVRDCDKLKIHHADIHAGNFLMFFSQQKIKLCDFGLLSTYNSQQSGYSMSVRTISIVIQFINDCSLSNEIFEFFISTTKTNISRKYNISLQEAENHPDYLIEAKEKIAEFLNANQQLAETLVDSEKYCRENKDTCLADKIISEIEEKSTCKPLTPLKKVKKHGGCVVS